MDAECDAISDSAGGTDAAATDERTDGHGRASGNTDTAANKRAADANAGAGNGNPRPTSG